MIRVSIRGIRDIDSADIDLNGITVLAGRNGCGKSTISKLVYQTYFTAANYEKLISQEFGNYLVSTFQDIWRPTVDFVYAAKKFIERINTGFVYPSSPSDTDQIEPYLANVRAVLQKLRGVNEESYRVRLERLVRSYFAAINPHAPVRALQ